MVLKAKNILWDFDGVILDSMKIRDSGFQQIFNCFENNKVDEFISYHNFNGGLSRFHKIKYFYNNILNKTITEEQIQQYADRFTVLMKAQLSNPKHLILDSVKFIKSHYRDYNFHIVSGSEHNELNYLCEKLDLAKYFKSINGSPTAKIDLVKSLLEKEKYKKNETILIGDSFNDFEAAQINSIKFYGYNNIDVRFLDEYIETFANYLKIL